MILANTQHATILDCRFEDFEADAVLLRAASSAVIRECAFTNGGGGDIRVAPGSRTVLIGNRLEREPTTKPK
jgi:hypothetical protein